MSVQNSFDFGPEERKAIIDTARWVAGSMVFLGALAAAAVVAAH